MPFFFFKSIESYLCCLYVHGCRAAHWTLEHGQATGAIPGKLVPQLLVAPQLEVEPCEPFHPCWNVDWSCTGSRCEWCSWVQCSAVQSVRAPVCMCENFLELVLSFYHVGPSDRTQVVRLSRKRFYPPSFKNFLLAPYPLFWPYITSQLKPS